MHSISLSSNSTLSAYTLPLTDSNDSTSNNSWLYFDNTPPPPYTPSTTHYPEECKKLQVTKDFLEDTYKNNLIFNHILEEYFEKIIFPNDKFYFSSNTNDTDNESICTVPNVKKVIRKGRRVDNQIDKCFKCLVEGCEKAYGTRDAMNFHIKKKHPLVSERLAKERREKLCKVKGSKKIEVIN